MIRHQADAALFVTSGAFAEATEQEFADDPRITLMDGDALLAKLESLSGLPEWEARAGGSLLTLTERIAAAAKPTRAAGDPEVIEIPRCSACGKTMVLGYSKGNNERFWGCVDYDRGCRGNSIPLRDRALAILDSRRSQRGRNG